MNVTVKLFGPEARAAGSRQVQLVDVPEPVTCASLGEMLSQRHPELFAALPRCRFAVNHEFVKPDDLIHPGDEVALIGQVSGG
jgi:sulfur-carrier protein